MKVAVGADHAGVSAKKAIAEKLRSDGHEVVDCGPEDDASVDYPDYAANVAGLVSSGEVDRGILVCGTGIGMSMTANKFRGVRAAVCHDAGTVDMTRRHNDANVLCLGSRILGGGALRGGMPAYKYFFNRVLTFTQNLMTGMKLSEYHTGYRAFTRSVLETLNLTANSDDFVFDNQILVQAHYAGFRIAEITCPTKYFDEASSINFLQSVRYGLGCLWTSVLYLLAKIGAYRDPLFQAAQNHREASAYNFRSR